jgi:hypothetical protein
MAGAGQEASRKPGTARAAPRRTRPAPLRDAPNNNPDGLKPAEAYGRNIQISIFEFAQRAQNTVVVGRSFHLLIYRSDLHEATIVDLKFHTRILADNA